MFKKVYNLLTAPVSLLIVAGMMIYVALVLAFNEEERRQYNCEMGYEDLD